MISRQAKVPRASRTTHSCYLPDPVRLVHVKWPETYPMTFVLASEWNFTRSFIPCRLLTIYHPPPPISQPTEPNDGCTKEQWQVHDAGSDSANQKGPTMLC